MGYARCGRLPQEREADAVRFGLAGEQNGRVRVRYVFEIAHRPGESGVLEFDRATGQWLARAADERLQRMAECFLQAKTERRAAAGAQQS